MQMLANIPNFMAVGNRTVGSLAAVQVWDIPMATSSGVVHLEDTYVFCTDRMRPPDTSEEEFAAALQLAGSLDDPPPRIAVSGACHATSLTDCQSRSCCKQCACAMAFDYVSSCHHAAGHVVCQAYNHAGQRPLLHCSARAGMLTLDSAALWDGAAWPIAPGTLIRGVSAQAFIDFHRHRDIMAPLAPANGSRAPAVTFENIGLVNLPTNTGPLTASDQLERDREVLGHVASFVWLLEADTAALAPRPGLPLRRLRNCVAVVSCEEIEFLSHLFETLEDMSAGGRADTDSGAEFQVPTPCCILCSVSELALVQGANHPLLHFRALLPTLGDFRQDAYPKKPSIRHAHHICHHCR